MDEAFRLAKLIAIAGWAPKSYLVNSSNPSLGYSPEKIAIAIMQGLEVGLTPMAAVQSIAVINGMPSLWGDGALGVVLSSGLVEDFKEIELFDGAGKFEGWKCTALRRGRPEPIENTFTLEDAAKAALLTKTGPWQTAPKRMCKMRARAFTLRDGFADVMRGFKVAEEAMDYVDMGEAEEVEGAGRVAPKQQRSISGKATASTLDAFAGKKADPAPGKAEKASDSQQTVKTRTTNVREGKEVNSNIDLEADRIAPTSGAKQQTTDGDDLIGASMTMPAAAARQFREGGKWMPAFSWLSVTLPKIADPKVKQEFVDQFAEFFEVARASGAAKQVEKLLIEQGVTFDTRN
jgi:hypothetical protein